MNEQDISRYLMEKPVKEGREGDLTHLSTYVSDAQVPGINYHAQLGWITETPDEDSGKGAVVSGSDKIILFWGNDYKNPESLGGEIEFYMDGKKSILNSSTSVFIPAGVSHGPVKWNSFDKPHMEMVISLDAGNLNGETAADKVSDLKHIPDPEKYIVHKPAYEVVAPTVTKNRMHPSMTFMSNDLVPGSNTYLEFAWIWDMPDPNPHIMEHSHEDYNELVFHIGSNPDDPEDLGAEIEFYLDGKPVMLKKTSAMYAPKKVSHGPLIWQSVTRPHIEMAIIFGAGVLAQSDPGGHRKSESMS